GRSPPPYGCRPAYPAMQSAYDQPSAVGGLRQERDPSRMLVGLIANPEAGHDIRRLVSHASTFNNQEKVYISRRVLMGLAAAGVERVAYLPEHVGLVRYALDGLKETPELEALDLIIRAQTSDSTDAARLLAERGAACLFTLCGDGTNRAGPQG